MGARLFPAPQWAGCASTCVVCALLMSLPAAWSLVAPVGRLGSRSSRTASRATDPLLQNKNHDESDAKTVERIAGTHYLTGRITAQDQEGWLSINKLNAQREATATKVVAALFVGAVMVVVMDPTAAGKVVEAMAQHPSSGSVFPDREQAVRRRRRGGSRRFLSLC